MQLLLKNFGFINPIYGNKYKIFRRKNKMSTIREHVLKTENEQIKNISDLDEVSTEIDIKQEECAKSDGEKFTIYIITIDNIKYRVPVSVLKYLKTLIIEKPGMTKFKVKKTGEGMDTSYTVIPLD